MTQQHPDEIRRDIETTRAQLSSDVDAVAEKLSPEAALNRQKNRIKEGFANVKDSIMGTEEPRRDEYGRVVVEPGPGTQVREGVEHVKDSAQHLAGNVQAAAGDAAASVQHAAEEAGHRIQDAPAAVKRGTRGNPLAAGLVAFGLGLLAASLIPASRAEQDAAQQLKDKAEPVVRDAAQHLAEQAKQPLAEAGEHLRAAAEQGVDQVRSEGQDQGHRLADAAQDSAQQVKDA